MDYVIVAVVAFTLGIVFHAGIAHLTRIQEEFDEAKAKEEFFARSAKNAEAMAEALVKEIKAKL